MLNTTLRNICAGLAAGLLISVGGCVFLACKPTYPVAGAVFFSVALLCICYMGYSLYTGKICYILDDHSGAALSVLLLGLVGNIIACVVCGIAIRYAIPNVGETATAVCTSKLGQDFAQTLIRGIFCGVMVYLSVAIFKGFKTPVGIVFCIPTFILAGFEHSIADIFYFGAAGADFFGNNAGASVGFLATVVLGNTVGGLLLPALMKVGKGNA